MKVQCPITIVVLGKLKKHGIECYMEIPENEFRTPWLRVPPLEAKNCLLSRDAIYAFIHKQLAGDRRKGFACTDVQGRFLDLYCYNPDVETTEQSGILIWNAGAPDLECFDWTGLIEGDDSAWHDGWDVVDQGDLSDRVAFLAGLLNFKIVDLPPVKPLTLEELGTLTSTARGPYLYGPDLNSAWVLRVKESGELYIYKTGTGETVDVLPEHIDAKGRLVVDGHVLLTRSLLFTL